MYQTINRSQFHDAFKAAGRGDQFSYEALDALFSAFEEMEYATGVPIELDVIAICCEYSEDHWADIADNYSIDLSEAEDGVCTASAYGLEQVEKAKRDIVREYLEHYTQIVGEPLEGVFVYQQF
jgi:hypothetical protein